MRLICPNCGAQYEVGEDLIPPAGRDVQCSNCGHTWLETPGASEAAEAEEAMLSDASVPERAPVAEVEPVAEPEVEPEPEAEPEPEPEDVAEVAPETLPETLDETLAEAGPEVAQAAEAAPEPEADPEPQPEAEPEAEPEAQSDPAPPAEEDAPLVVTDAEEEEDDPLDPGQEPAAGEARPLRTVAPEVAEILRQEAEREQAARAAEAAAGIESQPDLGLDQLMADEDRRAEEARKRLAMLRGAITPQEPREPEEPRQTAAADAGQPEEAGSQPRRELLPDIEEINSTLRASSEHGPTAEAEALEAEVEKRRGFRLGFGLVLLVAVLLALVYAFAPRIMATIPQSEPILTPYVATINDGRLWLDLRLQDLLNTMEDSEPAAE